MSLYGYGVCEVPIQGTSQTRISAIHLVYADEEAEEVVELPGVGPNAADCEKKFMEHREPISFIRVYGGGSFIIGIALIHDIDTPVTLIGKTSQSSF